MCVSGKYAEINAGIGIAGKMRRRAQMFRPRCFVSRIMRASKRRQQVRYKSSADRAGESRGPAQTRCDRVPRNGRCGGGLRALVVGRRVATNSQVRRRAASAAACGARATMNERAERPASPRGLRYPALRTGGKRRLLLPIGMRRKRSLLCSSSKCESDSLTRSLRETMPTSRRDSLPATTGRRSSP